MAEEPLLGEMIVLDDLGPPRRSRIYPALGAAALLLLPATVLLANLVLRPVVYTVRASLFDHGRFVGLVNFREVLADPAINAATLRTLVWAFLVPVAVTIVGFLIAVAGRGSPWSGIATALMVAPVAMPLVVTGVTFRILYDPDPGRGLGTAGLRWLASCLGFQPERVPPWLGPRLIGFALVTAFAWAWVGLAVVVFRTALHAIPQTLVDSVRVNGGSRWDVFLDAMWRPLVRRTAAIVFALIALGTTRVFDLILVAAPGSAFDQASVLSVSIWQSNPAVDPGRAAAIGVLWLAMMTVSALAAAAFYRQAWPAPLAAQTEPASFTAGGPSVPRRWGRQFRLLRSAGSLLVVMVWVVPFLGLISTSLHSRQAAATGPWWRGPWGFGSYRDLFSSQNTLDSLLLTAFLAVVVTSAVLVIALLAAGALAWLLPPGARWAGLALMAAAVVPVQAIAWQLTGVLTDSAITADPVRLGLVHIALGVPLAVLILRNALADLPIERLKYARGIGGWTPRALWRAVSAIGPAVVTVAVLQFVQVWNDFAIGLFFAGGVHQPVGPMLFEQVRDFVSSGGQLAAGCVIAVLPPLTLVILTRRWLIAGLVSGAAR